MKARLIWKKSCDSCRRFKKALDEMGAEYEGREMNSEPLDAQFVASLMGDREVKPFLNTRNVVYREQGLSKSPPSRERAIELISETNNLLRRPVLIVGDEMLIGADLERARTLLSK